LTKFTYSFLIGISLLLIPQSAYADEILVELNPETAYVDTVVDVTGPTEYFIETFTGPRIEIQANGTPRVRDGWVDSWIELRQGEVILRADDDSNHVTGVNEYASKITGTIDTGTYTIRATSYLNRVGYGNPTGVYTLSSNLIQPPPPPVVVEPIPPVVVEPIVDTIVPTVPDIVVIEPPIMIPSPPEPPLVEEILPEPEPPMEAEEPPLPVEEPPVPAEEPPTEAEPAPEEAEEPPMVEEEAPIPVEEPPAEAEEPPVEVVQLDEVDLETLAPETPVQLDNGVVLEAGTVVALQLLENPAELIAEIFSNPGQVLTALSNIGADMSEEERTESEQTIIASVIATQAAVNAVGAANMARTATPTPTPSGGAPSANDNIKLYKRRKP
jgi:hypothetical protein